MNKSRNPKDFWITITDGNNLFDAEFRAGAMARASELGLNRIRIEGCETILANLESSKALRESNLAIICHLRDKKLLDFIKQYNIPAILLGFSQHNAEEYIIPSCSTNNEAIAQIAADYFYEQNRFASYVYVDAFTSPDWDWWTKIRRESFQRTLQEHGFNDSVYHLNLLDLPPQDDAKRFLNNIKDIPRPIAIFACNDRVAREIVTFCDIGSLHVPDDIAVLGVDDEVCICENAPTSISSIKIEHHRLGRIAINLMHEMIESGNYNVNRRILCPPVRVVERNSTSRQEPKDHHVARALNYIRTAHIDLLNVENIVIASGSSRSYLQKHFKNETGRTILGAIHNRLLEDVKRMLEGTNKPISEIAAITGLVSFSSLCTLFKRKYGISMKEYRNKQHNC